MAKTGNGPVKKYQFGNVTVNIWENKVGNGKDAFVTQSVSISKSFKDKEGNWKNSESFQYKEVPFIIMALEQVMRDKYYREDITEVSMNDEEL